jgi:hypothetical protein
MAPGWPGAPGRCLCGDVNYPPGPDGTERKADDIPLAYIDYTPEERGQAPTGDYLARLYAQHSAAWGQVFRLVQDIEDGAVEVEWREPAPRKIDTAVAMILSHEAVQGLTTGGPVGDTGGNDDDTTVQEDTMSQTTNLTAVNTDATDVRTGHAVLGIVLAQAALRPDLASAVEGFVFDHQNGIAVLVNSAGARQHLANALALPKGTESLLLAGGFGTARRGEMLGITVTIWNTAG